MSKLKEVKLAFDSEMNQLVVLAQVGETWTQKEYKKVGFIKVEPLEETA